MRNIQESDRYMKVIKTLRDSKPAILSGDRVIERVYSEITASKRKPGLAEMILDLLFGWTRVNWVRRGLVAVSFILVLVFVIQQATILTELNHLKRYIESSAADRLSYKVRELPQSFILFRLTGRRIRTGGDSLTDEKLRELIESVGKLNRDYNELIEILDDYPEIKAMFERKISEKDKTENKL